MHAIYISNEKAPPQPPTRVLEWGQSQQLTNIDNDSYDHAHSFWHSHKVQLAFTWTN